MVEQRRRLILVLGMHRSGTSVAARCIAGLGATLPKTLMPAVPEENPQGYAESSVLARLHDEYLREVGRRWDSVWPLLDSRWQGAAGAEWAERLADAVTDEFGRAATIVVKDPRMCLFVPLWLDVARRLDREPSAVLPVRDPLSVAASLARRGIPEDEAVALWLRHVLEAERATRTISRHLVIYSRLLDRPAEEIAAIGRWMGASRPTAEVESCIDTSLQHHVATAAETTRLAGRYPPAARCWETFCSENPLGERSQRKYDTLWQRLRAADALFGHGLERREHRLLTFTERHAGLVADLSAARAEAGTAAGALAACRQQVDALRADLAEFEVLKSELAAVHDSCRKMAGQLRTAQADVTTTRERLARVQKKARCQTADLADDLDKLRQELIAALQRERELREDLQPFRRRARAACGMPKISIVVVFHDMQREAARTLHTLTSEYQRGIAVADYEVIAIDNGSRKSPVSPELVRGFGSNFHGYRYEPGSPSPAAALNHGAGLAAGDIVVMMIDGARMLSPGILHYVSAAAAAFADPFIYTVGMHLGPQPQNLSLLEGYGRDAEDRLLETIDWRRNGYDLFRISTALLPMTDGFFSTLSESNCFAMRRETYFKLGGFDERFQSPGGGLVNLDMYNRALSDTAIEPVCLLGEATFHQFHGGVATNVPLERHPWARFAEEYRAIRRVPYDTVKRAPHYLGHAPSGCEYLLGPVDAAARAAGKGPT